MKEEIKLINIQMIATSLFIISLVISLLLSYDDKANIQKKITFFSEKNDQYISLANRLFSFILLLVFLYINIGFYNQGLKNNENTEPLKLQIYAAIFSLISAITILYVAIKYFSEEPSISNIENPIF